MQLKYVHLLIYKIILCLIGCKLIVGNLPNGYFLRQHVQNNAKPCLQANKTHGANSYLQFFCAKRCKLTNVTRHLVCFST